MDTSGASELGGGEAARAAAGRAELAARIAAAVPIDASAEVLPGLRFRRASALTPIGQLVSSLVLCVIAQGSKEIWLGREAYRYDPAHYLITSAGLPVASRITAASPARPLLTLVLTLEPAMVGSVIAEAGQPAARRQTPVRAIAVSTLDADLLEAVVRLARLVTTPADAPVLAPLITREIIYRLLAGEQGERLRQIATRGEQTHPITQAITRLRADYVQPLRIAALADELGMSLSSFHHHFKEVTAMSPLEFQKQLRLQEARRLMLSEGLDAAGAGFRVGYNDASHFTREYKRRFGEPPRRDVDRLRGLALEPAGF